MHIQDVRTFVVGNPPPHRGGRNWVFLRLRTDEGLIGYGEAYAVPFDARMVARLIEDVGERLVIGAESATAAAYARRVSRLGMS